MLYNTVDTEYIINKSKEKIEDIEFDKEYINLISVGKLSEEKGYLRLLNIFKKLEKDYKIKLYLLGNGKEENKLKAFIKNNNLSEKVLLLGYNENPYKYVRNADLFVCSSYKEGYSTAVTESLIVGTPVITTLCSGMEEMLNKGEYGLIVKNEEENLYEGLKSIIQDEKMLKSYKEKAKERSNYFSLKNNVAKIERFIDEI